MDFQWNQPTDREISNRYILENSRRFHSGIVETAMAQVLLEMIAWVEKIEKARTEKQAAKKQK